MFTRILALKVQVFIPQTLKFQINNVYARFCIKREQNLLNG
jgi:hypothetical protein